MRRLNKWTDRQWTKVGGDKLLMLIAIAPLFATIFIGREWAWLAIAWAVVWIVYVSTRGLRVGRVFLRPIDRARDRWASDHQSADYAIKSKKERR